MIPRAGDQVSFWGESTRKMLAELEPKMRGMPALPAAELDRLVPTAGAQLRKLSSDPFLWPGSLQAMIDPLATSIAAGRLPEELAKVQGEALRLYATGETDAARALIARVVAGAKAGGEVGPSWAMAKATGALPPGEEIPAVRFIGVYQKLPMDSEESRAINRAFEMDKMGKSKEALELYEKTRPAVEAAGDPERLKFLYNRTGLALHHLGRDEEALKSCLDALAVAPEYPAPMYNLSTIRLALDDERGALQWLERAIGVDGAFFRDLAKRDMDFNIMRTNSAFRELVGLEPLPKIEDPRLLLETEVRSMHQAWPKDWAGEKDPPAFLDKADDLHAMKRAELASLGAKPSADMLRAVLTRANFMHGKAGHSENVSAIAEAFLGNAQFAAKLGARVDVDLVLAAAPWLNLADLEVPVKILAAHRRLTPEELAAHVAPRAEKSAALFEKFGLGSGEVARAIADHRPAAGKERSLESTLLDLFDQVAALGAKPFFRKEGKVDADKLLAELAKNNAKNVDAALLDAVGAAVREGLVDASLEKTRARDLYVK